MSLLPFHRAQLSGSAISDEAIERRGYLSVSRPTAGDESSRDLLKRCGIPNRIREADARYPGLLIPMYHPTGSLASWHYRPDNAGRDKHGKTRKYIAPAGKASVLDVHPDNRDRIIDPTVPLWITEGVKKGDALTSAGQCVVTLPGVYNWRGSHGTLGGWEDILLAGRVVNICFDADASHNANVARAMARLGKWLKSKNVKEVRYIVVPPEVLGQEVKGADDFLAAGGTVAELLAASSVRPPEVTAGEDTFTDAYVAQDLADVVLDARCVHVAGLGWMRWDGRRWESVPVKDVREAARDWVITEYEAAVEEYTAALRARDQQAAGRLHRHVSEWRKFQARGKLDAITSLAEGIVSVSSDAFDAHPDLLNAANGVVDLKTGELLPHDPELYMTKITQARYVPEATHEDWEKALEALPAEDLGWYQGFLGQAISGHTPPDDIMVVQQGSGSNGKTSVLDAIQTTLGDYFLFVPHRALTADARAHPTEMTEFKGARLALLEELPEGRQLNTTKLKQTVGTPTMTARKIGQDSITWRASHTLMLSTNYRPTVSDTDHGTWRRLVLVRFPYTFVKEELVSGDERQGDKGLKARLGEGKDGRAEAVLAWLAEGAVRWYQADKTMPDMPERIAEDTREWREDSDSVYGFLTDTVVADKGRNVMTSELYESMRRWLSDHGQKEWSDKLIAERMEGHAFTRELGMTKPKSPIRGTKGLSRWPGRFTDGGDVIPLQYHSWVGIRFVGDQSHAADDAADQAESEGVTGVTAPPGDSKYDLPRRNGRSSRHTRHSTSTGADSGPRRTTSNTRGSA